MYRANAFSLFLKSQRKWTSPPLKETSVSMFKERMKEYGYAPRYILPHGSYLINLGNPDKFVVPLISPLFFFGNLNLIPWLVDSEKREKSYGCFLDDLRRCEQLGLTVYNFQYASSVLFVIYAHGENCDNGEVQARLSVPPRLSTLFLSLLNVSIGHTKPPTPSSLSSRTWCVKHTSWDMLEGY